MKRLDNDWEFTSAWQEEFGQGKGQGTSVRLPHTGKEVPLHDIDSASYQGICGYRRHLRIPASMKGRRLFLQFDGAAHLAEVFVNGVSAGQHRCGYTGFRLEITSLVHDDADNLIAVRLDTTENSSVPPFGFMIDYLTFGGLYRDVWLDDRPQLYLQDVYCASPDAETAELAVTLDGQIGAETLAVTISRPGQQLASAEFPAASSRFTIHVKDAQLWSPEQPVLYDCAVALKQNGTVIDTVHQTMGFRTVKFSANEFLLNGKPYFLRGLNRHQCYPYVGYAVGQHLQEEDARILKEELHCNAVRTSHYPQSQYFLNACDRLGLLVFTEIPGWQHIGDADWQKQAVQNTEEMVMQNRQHPSIFLWGVRVNESQDNDALYRQTNEVAHRLDPYRATSGVRYLENSSLLEDVYSYNDFSHDGSTPGAKHKKDVMKKNMDRPLIITEANGHMFPTKAFDPWMKRQEQALRHARVLDAAMADHEHAGCFQWCMFDYPTHSDFGSGDRICYHGVMDSFRNPKLAAALYASQSDEQPVLEIGSPMDIGDYPAGRIGKVYAFSNADEVALYKNDKFVAAFRPKGWSGLKHGPIEIDDLIGGLLQSDEGYPPAKAELIHSCLKDAVTYGPANLPLSTKAKLAYAMARYHLSYADGVALFGKYVGNWGNEAVKWRFDAVRNGKVTASRLLSPNSHLHLEVKASSVQLREGSVYDMAAVRIRVLDGNGSLAPYVQLPVRFAVSGVIALVGPQIVTAEGGMTGTYVRTLGKAGPGELIISTDQTEPVRISYQVSMEDAYE